MSETVSPEVLGCSVSLQLASGIRSSIGLVLVLVMLLLWSWDRVGERDTTKFLQPKETHITVYFITIIALIYLCLTFLSFVFSIVEHGRWY